MRKINVLVDKVVYSSKLLAGLALLGNASKDAECKKNISDYMDEKITEIIEESEFIAWLEDQCLVLKGMLFPVAFMCVAHNFNKIIKEIGTEVIDVRKQIDYLN